ncbi:MAG: helix-turn-helix domain-containing protein [Bacilli bacterium]|nr:helix-turn-helix domain-containing protein [Bacilli bacterium]
MTEIEIKSNFSNNIRELRISKGLNQIQLGEKIHYSSKAISKWENGDVLPDIVTLNMIAEFFNITVDDLISNRSAVKKSHRKHNRVLITVSSCLLSYFVAAIVFLILILCHVPYAWRAFVVAAPTSAVTLIVLASLWFNKIVRNIGIIVLIWTGVLVAMIFMNFDYYWILLIVAAILSIIALIFFNIKFGSNKNEK